MAKSWLSITELIMWWKGILKIMDNLDLANYNLKVSEYVETTSGATFWIMIYAMRWDLIKIWMVKFDKSSVIYEICQNFPTPNIHAWYSVRVIKVCCIGTDLQEIANSVTCRKSHVLWFPLVKLKWCNLIPT